MKCCHIVWVVLFASLFSLFGMAKPAAAAYRQADLVNIPVDRLVENIKERIEDAEDDEENVSLRFNLARLHAMAWALKTDECQIWNGREERGAWFGYEPTHVPFEAQPADDEETLQEAREHLDAAILAFQDLLQHDENHFAAMLGLAWCLQQAEESEDALAGYREVIELAWEEEKEKRRAGLGWHSVAAEAAGYLIFLLDADDDREEIAELVTIQRQARRISRPVTPIAIPLEAGLSLDDLLDRDASVPFDLDGSGYKDAWTWITPQAAWLVNDPHATGKIDSGLQLFGGVTFWCFWENGYEALASLDDNADGQLTEIELNGLALWHDANSNGISEPGEVRSLADHGIVALACRGETGDGPDVAAQAEAGVTYIDGSTRPTIDLILNRRSEKTDE